MIISRLWISGLEGLSYLREVSRILEATKAEQNPFEGEVQVAELHQFDEWEEARLESLIGQALFHMSQVQESIPHFNKALNILGNEQPQTSFGLFRRLVKESYIQWRHNRHPGRFIGKTNPLLAHRLIEQARCLSHLFYDYMTCHDDKRALVTALQQVNRAEQANTDLHELIVAYTSMMECCLMKNWKEKGQQYEYKAQIRCTSAMTSVNADDLITIAHLYVTSLNMKLSWGRIPEAIDCGSMAERISSKLHNNDFRRGMLPSLAQALLLANRIIHCVETLEELKFIENETDCIITKTWYYNCCMDLLLEAGFQLEPFKACLQFAKSVKENRGFKSDHLPLYYLANNLALWFIRHEDLRAVDTWLKVAEQNIPLHMNTYMAIHGYVKHLETKLLLLTRSHKNKDSATKRQLTHRIKMSFKQLEQSCIKTPVFYPRLYHLQAYYEAIHGKLKSANNKLNKIKDLCTTSGNQLELLWVTHSQQVWLDPDHEKYQADIWLTSSHADMMDYHKANQVEGSIIKFSLPLPTW